MTRSNANTFLIFLFFSHGLLYFFRPEDLHNINSPIKWIKYLIVFVAIIVNIKSIKKDRFYEFVVFSVLTILLLIFSHSFSYLGGDLLLSRLLSYLAPFSVMLISDQIDKLDLKKTAIYVCIIAIVAAFYEYYFNRGMFKIYDYSTRGGFIRAVSIFINPNNASLFLTFAIIYLNEVIAVRNYKEFLLKWSLLFLNLFVIILTSSKTPFFLLAVYFILVFLRSSYLDKKTTKMFRYFIISCFFVIPIAFFIVLNMNFGSVGELREWDMATGEIRYNETLDYFHRLDADFLTPNYYSLDITYDISFLQLWSDFSFLGLLLFVIFLVIKYFKKVRRSNYIIKLALFLLILSSFSVQIYFIWPSAYIFWYLIYSNRGVKLKVNKNFNPKPI